jgi:hypothetical protein
MSPTWRRKMVKGPLMTGPVTPASDGAYEVFSDKFQATKTKATKIMTSKNANMM